MTNEEKILLVLEMLGVDSVAKAKKELTELNKALDETKQAADQASGKGKKGFNAGGLLDLAYALDDLQYGIKGVVNNIPRLAQVLGAGAGLAGAATIAAVGINQLVQRHPEWFEWTGKVKEKIGELVSQIEAEEAAIKKQKEAIDKLKESNSSRLEDLYKLISATEDLKEKEAELAKQKADQRAAEEMAKNPGVAAKEDLAKMKQALNEAIVEPGFAKGVQDAAVAQRAKQLDAVINDEMIKGVAKDFKLNFQTEVEKTLFAGMPLGSDEEQRAFALSDPKLVADAEKKVMSDFRQKFGTEARRRNTAQAQREFAGAMGGMQNAQTPEEFDQAFKQFQQLNPVAAKAAYDQLMTNLDDESFTNEQNRAIAAGQRRRAKQAEERAKAAQAEAVGPNRLIFDQEQDRQAMRARAEAERAMIQDANIRNTVLGQFDPLTMALFRRQQAGTGRDAQRNLAALESRDVEFYSQALVTQGMDAGRARQAAMESLRGGESSFQQMAAGMGLNVRNVNQGFEASVSIMERLMQENEEQKMKTMMLMQRLNIMDQGNGAPARPQMNRVPR